MLKTAMIAAGSGGISALLSLGALAGSAGGAIVAYFTPLPLLLVGLGHGIIAASIAALSGVAMVALFGSVAAAGIYGGVHAFPSWLVVRQALARRQGPGEAAGEWQEIGSLLCLLAVLAAVAALAVALAGGGGAGVEQSVRKLLATVLGSSGAMLAEAQRAEIVERIVPLFIGASGATWVVMMVVNAVTAQAFLSRQGWNLRPSPKWSDLTLPDWMSWVLVASAVAALVSPGDAGYLARNLVLILAVPYFFLGLAVIHSLTRRLPSRGLLLTGFYVVLVIAFVAVSVAVAALGVIEQWGGVRRRFAGTGSTQGNE